ncbi:MAG: molybdenum cofactor biosynthesis protein MoaE [Dehalococcoidia bacterium]|jgi:molybdopterin synthase catalytic subunit
MIELTKKALDPFAVIESVRGNPANGAVVSFIGSLRDLSADGKPLRHAEIELEADAVRVRLNELSEEIGLKWNLSQVSISHRYGRIGVGELILVVAISAKQRKAAFEACQYTIDRVKELHRLIEIV